MSPILDQLSIFKSGPALGFSMILEGLWPCSNELWIVNTQYLMGVDASAETQSSTFMIHVSMAGKWHGWRSQMGQLLRKKLLVKVVYLHKYIIYPMFFAFLCYLLFNRFKSRTCNHVSLCYPSWAFLLEKKVKPRNTLIWGKKQSPKT